MATGSPPAELGAYLQQLISNQRKAESSGLTYHLATPPEKRPEISKDGALPSLKLDAPEREQVLLAKLPVSALSIDAPCQSFDVSTAQDFFPSSVYLTSWAAGPSLPAWIFALSKTLRGICTRMHGEIYQDRYSNPSMGLRTSTRTQRDSYAILRALYHSRAELTVLNLGDLQLELTESSLITESSEDVLCDSLQHSSALLELELPITTCVLTTLPRVSLSKLETIAFRWNSDISRVHGINLLTRILHAIDAYPVRNLQLKDIVAVPFTSTDHEYFPAKLCRNLSSLHIQPSDRIDYDNTGPDEANRIPSFVSLFENITDLFWAGPVTASHLNTVFETCKQLKRLNLTVKGTFKEPSAKSFDDLFSASRGMLTSISSRDMLSVANWNALGEKCPLLEQVKLPVNRTTIAGVYCLCTQHHRRLTALDLQYDWDCGSPGADGWEELTRAVLDVSPTLRRFSLESDEDCFFEAERDIMLDSIKRIIRYLQRQATHIILRMPIDIGDAGHMLQTLTGLLTSIVENGSAPYLQTLILKFNMGDVDYTWPASTEFAEACTTWQKLLLARDNLYNIAPVLLQLDLDGWIDSAKKCEADIPEEYVEPV